MCPASSICLACSGGQKKKSVEGINKQVNKERNEGITLETLNIIQLRLCQGLTDYYYKVTIDTLSWE